MSTDFSVDSSNRFLFIAQTDILRQTNKIRGATECPTLAMVIFIHSTGMFNNYPRRRDQGASGICNFVCLCVRAWARTITEK